MKKSFGINDAAKMITAAAALYQNMVGRVYLYVFDSQFIEVTYRVKEFRHLTGIGTHLPAVDFYKNALNKKLTPNQLFFDARHPAKLCARKMRHIQNLSAAVCSDLIVLEKIGTHSKQYEFGFTDLNFTLCLDKDLDAQGQARSHYYIVQSLRDEDAFSKSGQQYICNYIFSKPNDAALYDTINFADKKLDLESLPQPIKDRLSPDIA